MCDNDAQRVHGCTTGCAHVQAVAELCIMTLGVH